MVGTVLFLQKPFSDSGWANGINVFSWFRMRVASVLLYPTKMRGLPCISFSMVSVKEGACLQHSHMGTSSLLVGVALAEDCRSWVPAWVCFLQICVGWVVCERGNTFQPPALTRRGTGECTTPKARCELGSGVWLEDTLEADGAYRG